MLLAWWLLRWQGQLWRRAVAEEAREALTTLASRGGARTRRLHTGWRVAWDGVRVDYRGGLGGYATVVRVGGEVVLKRQELLSAEEVLRAVRESGHGAAGSP